MNIQWAVPNKSTDFRGNSKNMIEFDVFIQNY